MPKKRDGLYTDPRTDTASMMVKVKNVGPKPIATMHLEWCYEYEAPQDVTAEFASMPGKKIEVHEASRRYAFTMPSGDGNEALQPGDTRTFLYPAEWMPAVRSIVESLSPERYQIAVTMNGKEEVAIPGNHVGSFVQQLPEGKREDD